MAISTGKRFEKNIKDSCEKQGILWERFIDGNKWGGGNAESIRFTPDSPYDGIIYKKGIMLCVECKTAQTGSISFNQPPYFQPKDKPKPCIKAHQVKSLVERAKYEGVNAGLLVEFSDRQTKTKLIEGGCFFIDIETFVTWTEYCGKKSMNVEDARYIGTVVDSVKLKVNSRYDIKKLLERICKQDE